MYFGFLKLGPFKKNQNARQLQTIAVTCSFSKTLEKAKSIVDAIFPLTTFIVKELHQTKSVSGDLFDLRNGFDRVNHGLLLEKLENIWIGGTTQKCFSYFLTGRRQIVKMPSIDEDCITYSYSEKNLSTPEPLSVQS